jgi:hypothetical protein
MLEIAPTSILTQIATAPVACGPPIEYETVYRRCVQIPQIARQDLVLEATNVLISSDLFQPTLSKMNVDGFRRTRRQEQYHRLNDRVHGDFDGKYGARQRSLESQYRK